MAVIYLRHPRHGDKVAISDAEAVADERNGWVRYNPSAPVISVSDDVPEFLNTLAPRRRGRPPKVSAEAVGEQSV